MSILSHITGLKAVAIAASLFAVASHSVYAVTSIADNFKSITTSGANLVALDFDSDLYTSSDDGASFVLRETTSDIFEDVAGLGSTAIAVGIDGLVLRSANDGVAWSAAVSPNLFGSLFAVAGRTDGSNSNQWISVGDDSFDGVIYRSLDDGQNWTQSATLVEEPLTGATWTGVQWLICGRNDVTNTGTIKYSTDGVTWTASSLPSDSQPILAIANDGDNNVVAVGELGEILRSDDDGLNFTRVSSSFNGSGDLRAVIVDGSGVFFAGGDEKLILEIDGTSVSAVVPAAVNAAPVLDFVVINGQVAAIGSFFSSTRTVPFSVAIVTGGSADFVLTVAESLVGKTYYVETTTDLTQVEDTWTVVLGTSVSGTNGALTFDVAEDEERRFWRVVEF